jgi:hypothetical protein
MDARMDDATPKYQNTDPKNPETVYYQPLYPHLSIKIEIPCITLTGHEPSMYPPRKKRFAGGRYTFFLYRFSLFTHIKSTPQGHEKLHEQMIRASHARIQFNSIGFDDDDDDVDVT